MVQTAFLDALSDGISLGIEIGSAQLLVELGSGAWLCASLFVGCGAGVRLPHIQFNHVVTSVGTITVNGRKEFISRCKKESQPELTFLIG